MRRIRTILPGALLVFVVTALPPPGVEAQTLGACLRAPQGLTGWWPGDGTTADVIGGRDAVLDGATFGAGIVGEAFVFDGFDDFVYVPHQPALEPGRDDFAIEMWVNFANVEGTQSLAGMLDEWIEFSHGWGLTYRDRALAFGLAIPAYEQPSSFPGYPSISSDPLDVQPSRWLHVAAVRHRDTLEVFFNGESVVREVFPGLDQEWVGGGGTA